MSQILLLGPRGRPEIQPTVAFLCTRVKDADLDNWNKLRRLMLYVKHTEDNVLTLITDDMQITKWWVDGLYATHQDCAAVKLGVHVNGPRGNYTVLPETKPKYSKLDRNRDGSSRRQASSDIVD